MLKHSPQLVRAERMRTLDRFHQRKDIAQGQDPEPHWYQAGLSQVMFFLQIFPFSLLWVKLRGDRLSIF